MASSSLRHASRLAGSDSTGIVRLCRHAAQSLSGPSAGTSQLQASYSALAQNRTAARGFAMVTQLSPSGSTAVSRPRFGR
jgi:hypothetical protein